jgi:hypothetical protein
MAGAANPAMTRRGGGIPNISDGPEPRRLPGGGLLPGTEASTNPITNPPPMTSVSFGGGSQGGSPAPVAQPVNNSMANPYNQASMAQQASMARVGQGMGQTAAGGMAAYQNPYQQQVIDATLRDIGGAQQMAMNQLGAQATQANAFGGSRQGIAEAETNKAFNQQAIDAVSRMRQQGFNTALGASQADLNRQLGAAGQLAGLGQQSFNYGQALNQQQMQQGAMQQAAMQQLIDAGKQQFQGFANQPQQNLSTLLQAITAQPSLSGKQTSFNPGLFNYMQMFG